MTELENLQDFDDEKLEHLERELEIVEEKVREARLNEKLEKLQADRTQQKALVQSYNDELARLRKEVDNIAQIADSLPDGCFKSITLEP